MPSTSLRTTERTSQALAPAPKQLTRFLEVIISPERDGRGALQLRRPLTAPERQGLLDRRGALQAALRPAQAQEIAAAVSRMFLGFSVKNMGEEEAAAVVTQYVMVLRGLPLWAVERACMRFASGKVVADEIGSRRIDRGFPPTSAELATVARAEAYKAERERAAIDAVVGAKPEPVIDVETRERVKGLMEGLSRKIQESANAL